MNENIKIEIPPDVQQRMLQYFFEINLRKYQEENKIKSADLDQEESTS